MADDGATQALWGSLGDEDFDILPSGQLGSLLPEVGSLKVEGAAGSPTTLPLYLGVNVITRGSSNASIRGQNSAAGESTVELAASSVSKYHATLELHREGLLWFLTDLGSTNGVFISKSGRKLRCQPHCKYGMSSGDRVRFGDVEATVRVWAVEGEEGGGDGGDGQKEAEMHAALPSPMPPTTAEEEQRRASVSFAEPGAGAGVVGGDGDQGDGAKEGVGGGEGVDEDGTELGDEEAEQLGAETVPEEDLGEVVGEGGEQKRRSGAQSVEGAQPGVAGADIGGGAATEGGAAQGGVIGEEKDKTNQEAGVGEAVTHDGVQAVRHDGAMVDPILESATVPATQIAEHVSEDEEPSATQELPQSPATARALAKGSLEPVNPAVGVAAPLGPGWRTAKGKTGTPAKATASGSDPDHLLDDNLRATADALISRHKKELQHSVANVVPRDVVGGVSGGTVGKDSAVLSSETEDGDVRQKLAFPVAPGSAAGWRSRKTDGTLEQEAGGAADPSVEAGQADEGGGAGDGEAAAVEPSGQEVTAMKGAEGSSGSDTELPDENPGDDDKENSGAVDSSRQVESPSSAAPGKAIAHGPDGAIKGQGSVELAGNVVPPVATHPSSAHEPSDSDVPTTPIFETVANSDFEDAAYEAAVSGANNVEGEKHVKQEEEPTENVEGGIDDGAAAAAAGDGSAEPYPESAVSGDRAGEKVPPNGVEAADDGPMREGEEAGNGGNGQDEGAIDEEVKPTPPGEGTQAAMHALEVLGHVTEAPARGAHACPRSSGRPVPSPQPNRAAPPANKTPRGRRRQGDTPPAHSIEKAQAGVSAVPEVAARSLKQPVDESPQDPEASSKFDWKEDEQPSRKSARIKKRRAESPKEAELSDPSTPKSSRWRRQRAGGTTQQPVEEEAQPMAMTTGERTAPQSSTRAGGRRRRAVTPTEVSGNATANDATQHTNVDHPVDTWAEPTAPPEAEAPAEEATHPTPRTKGGRRHANTNKQADDTCPDSTTPKISRDGFAPPEDVGPKETTPKTNRRGKRHAEPSPQSLEDDTAPVQSSGTPKAKRGGKRRVDPPQPSPNKEQQSVDEPEASEAKAGPDASEPVTVTHGGKRRVDPSQSSEVAHPSSAIRKATRAGGASARKRPRSTAGESSMEAEYTQDADLSSSRSTRRRVSTRDGAGAVDGVTEVDGGRDGTVRIRVMFSTCIGKALLKRHTATISALGGSVADPSDVDFTHYVTIDGKARDKTTGFIKSFKTLLALAAGRPIVDVQWLEACKLQKEFVGVEEFMLKDPAAEKEHEFSIAGAYTAARSQLLLTGFSIFFTPKLLKEERNPEQLKSLVAAAGGEVADEVPRSAAPGKGSNGPPPNNVLVFAGSSDKSWCRSHLRAGLPVYRREQLVAALMQQRLPSSRPCSP